MDKNKTIDLDYINNTFACDKSVFKKILYDATECFAVDIKELKEFTKKKNWQELESLAHKMAGSSSYCGALKFKELCHQLEKTLQEQENEKDMMVSKLNTQVIAEYEKLQAAIKEILEK